MSKTKIHIDQLFAKGLENLELPVFSSDFEKIKAEVPSASEGNSVFENFELPVTDKDWQGIKERLEKESGRTTVLLPTEYAKDVFKDFEIAVTDADWKATKNKLEASSKKKMVWWWWLNMAIIGILVGALANYFSPLHSNSSAVNNTVQTELKNASASTTNHNSGIENKSNLNTTAPNTTNNQNADGNVNSNNNISNFKQATADLKTNSSEIKISSTNEVIKKISNYKLNSASENSNSFKTKKENTQLTTISQVTETTPVANENKTAPNNLVENTPSTLDSKPIEPSTKEVIPTAKTEEPVNSIPTIPAVDQIDTSKKETPKTTTTPPPGPPKIIPQFYVGLVTDIDRTYRHLSNNNPSSYNTIRNNADKAITQFSYGFVAGMQKSRNQFQMGAQMTSQNFTSTYNYQLTIQDSLPVYRGTVLIGKFPFGNKRDTTISGSTEMVVKKVNIPFSYNRFWKLDSKTELMTGMSGIIGINVKSSGDYLLNPANNQLYHFNYLKKAQNTLAFSPGLSIGIQRKISTSFILQTNFAASYTATNRFDSDFSMKQYPYSNNASKFNAQEHLYSYGLSIKLLYLLHQ